jgi:hypothetical protein
MIGKSLRNFLLKDKKKGILQNISYYERELEKCETDIERRGYYDEVYQTKEIVHLKAIISGHKISLQILEG